MKKLILLFLIFSVQQLVFAQRPSKEQMEADKKKFEAEKRKLDEQLSKMDPKTRAMFEQMTGKMGATDKMAEAERKIANGDGLATATGKTGGIVPAKNTKAISAIAATPSTNALGAFIGTTGTKTFAAILPGAKNMASEIYKALKDKGSSTDEIGNAASLLWMQGRVQIALSLMATVCKENPGNTDNLNNYASMLTMMGGADMAIPILTNLNQRFKKNSTILNNLGQAWFALGDMEKAKKYLDSTLIFAATHAQANETLALIAENKGNKAAALAHAKVAFKQGMSSSRKDKLSQLGYRPNSDDYSGFPSSGQSKDQLNLGSFSALDFPKSYSEMKAYQDDFKKFRSTIDLAIKSLQKVSSESNNETLKRLERQQKDFMDAMNRQMANPGSVSAGSASQIVGVPMFSEKITAKEKLLLENLAKKKQAISQQMAGFIKGEGATYKKAYEATMHKISERGKNVGQGGSESNEALCAASVKAVDDYLLAFNTRYEELYKAYLVAQKQYLNEFAYLSMYTTYPELLPGIMAGLKIQWLNDLAFKAENLDLTYGCGSVGKTKGVKLSQFKDPNCDINSEFGQSLGVANLGFNIKLDCSGMTTEFNALILGIKLTQDLDHASFGDSFRNCTVSIGPKASVSGKVGPLEAGANVGGGVDVEIDKAGKITDVVVKVGAEVEAGVKNTTIKDTGLLGTAASGSAGVEGRVSLITGNNSVGVTGIFK